MLDRLLRGDHVPFSGRFTTYQAAQTAPGCVQQPRPPLIVAAHGPQALAVAARHGDVWSSYGGFGLSLDELMAVTWSRSDALTVACDACGRDPASIGRSLLVYSDSADPWSDRGALVRVVEELRSMGFDEVVFYWPAADRRADFERASLEVLPQLR